jgi:hypothetical protein
MQNLRVIPGAVHQQALRVLIIAHGVGTPQVVVQRIDGSEAAAVPVTPIPVSAALQGELNRDNLHLFVVQADGLTPATPYELVTSHLGAVVRTGVQTLPQVASAEGLKMVVATCYYDYFSYDAAYLATLQSTWCKDAAFKCLAGDNLYLDVAPDQRDIEGGYHETATRYVRYFWSSGYGEVLATLPTLTICDDHDFWNNYPEFQCHLARTSGANRKEYSQAGLECLRVFQAVLNGALPADDDLSFRFDEAPEVSMFMADLRSARTRMDATSPRMMPETALQALEAWAASLHRPGVLVLSQPLWSQEGGGFDYNPPDFADQYGRIWRALADAPYDIVIVSGDVHYSRILEIGLANGRSVYEIVTSPACHIPTVLSEIFGTYGSQGREEVTAPASVSVHNASGPAVKPRLLQYFFGTSVPNTLALLTFRGLLSGKVSVGCMFLDCLTQRIATAEALKVAGQTRQPITQDCHAEELFRLGFRA